MPTISVEYIRKNIPTSMHSVKVIFPIAKYSSNAFVAYIEQTTIMIPENKEIPISMLAFSVTNLINLRKSVNWDSRPCITSGF